MALRIISKPLARRSFSTSPKLFQTPIVGAPAPAPKKPVGGIRGGFVQCFIYYLLFLKIIPIRIVGFLVGFSLASAVASYHLLDEYRLASAILQSSVHELQASTQKVCLINPYSNKH